MGAKCQFKDNINSDVNVSNSSMSNVTNESHNSETVNHDILHALSFVSTRLTLNTVLEEQRNSCKKGPCHSLMASDPQP